ncbi:MAG TPA: hypothetical protein VMM38_01355 [Aridibacter sp.]|nr:hypothetical protein [Aridibacter sp.]
MPDKRIKCFFLEPTGETWERTIRRTDGTEIGKAEEKVYRRTDTGEEYRLLADAPAGAMWFAPWYAEIWTPQLEHVLVVRTPGGDWIIDSEASNCTNKAERVPYQKDHHCWIIHGEPPEVTVNKDGITCGAGGGSIMAGGWHGFLTNGYLEGC